MNRMVPGQPEFFSAQVAEARRFYRDPAAAGRAPLAVVCGGCEQCAPHYRVLRRAFPYWGIEFVAQGRGRLILRGQKTSLVAGTLFAYAPGSAQDITTDPDDPLVKYFVDFGGREAARLLRGVGIGPGDVFQSSAPNEIMPVFDDLVRTGLRDTPYTPGILAALLELLVRRMAETRIPVGSAGTPAFETYRRCRQTIGERWREWSTLEQAAGACHIDAAYLCRLFRRFDHVSPYQFLLRMRMNEAARRLQEPGTSVKQVAGELAYSDAFHFSRVFKKAMGVSPSHYLGIERRG